MECSDEPNGKCSIEQENCETKYKKKDQVVEGKECVPDKDIGVVAKPEESEDRISVRRAMIEHLSTNDQVFFRSLNEGEGELNKQQKIDMIEDLLDQDYGIFLAKYGKHLLKPHLCYFENRQEEDSLIVDIHLKHINKLLDQKTRSNQSTKRKTPPVCDEAMEVASELSHVERSRLDLRSQLLDHLSLSEAAHFKSQQVGEPDLSPREKRDVAEQLLNHSAEQFLSRFGTHLREEHLSYFDQAPCNDSYEVQYYLKQLRKTHCKVVSKVGIKNRRFEALKKMVDKGSYFCETEMRNRNPLLYEQLVGRFLTADERRERLNNIDTTNITFVNLLLEQMDREAVKKLRLEQEEAEDDALEEDEDVGDMSGPENMEDEDDSDEDNDLDKGLWGEAYTDNGASASKNTLKKREVKKVHEKKTEEDVPELSDAEKHLLMEEFRSNMFSNFLQGKDTNFDYSQVDYNPDYDDLEVQGQDEEERYFDEESSEGMICERMSDDEDLLDQFMARLQPEPTPHQLADKMNCLTHDET